MTDSNDASIATPDPRRGPQERRTQASRRQRIISALRECMISKGYAETNLTDVAGAAGMTVSHLLYYYASKDLILLDLTDNIRAFEIHHIDAHRNEPPEERLHILVDTMFLQNIENRHDLGLIRDIIALSTHHPALHKKISGHYESMLMFLEELFSQTPRQPGTSALDAAQTAAALMMGFTQNIGFDANLSNSSARRMYRRMLFKLANFESAHAVTAPAGTQRTSPEAAASRSPRRKPGAAKS